MKRIGLLLLVVLAVGAFQSCKNDDPSVVKIFVRSASNELVEGAKVVIVGDVSSNPATLADVDTLITNNSGFAQFNLEDHFAMGDKDYEVAYFDIFTTYNGVQTTGRVRSRIHTTAVETVYLP
ncbi:MAG: hypothetical protein QNK23_01740 [Crocinitomicaceae bacterium]|nr:hypothetical protein [Crocinitomicaceae bacterium]